MSTRVLACVLAIAAVVVGCGGGGDDRPPARQAATPTPAPAETRPDRLVPEDALLGVVSAWDGSGALLAPVSRRSLEPGVPWHELGEYHDSWSVSPDRRMAAFGVSAPGEEGRVGARVIDLATLRAVKDLEVGIVAEAVGWLTPDRLAAFLQSGEVVVLDPLSGREVARETVGAISCPYPPSAITPLGFVFVVADGGLALVVLADPQGRVQRLRLPRIPIGEAREVCQEAGLAVDPQRLVAYVVGAEAPMAEVDLRTMRVRNHRVKPRPRLLTKRGCLSCSADVSALWLDRGRLAVAGFHETLQRQRPAGVSVIDTRRGTARTIAPRAGAAVLAGDDLLVFDGRHPSDGKRRGFGLRIHDRSGRLRTTLLAGERVGDVQVAGRRAYARTPRGLRVIDLRRRRVIARFGRTRSDITLLHPR